MPVYCSNFYGSIQCRGYASRFGERCGFCTVHKRGRSLKAGLLPSGAEPAWPSSSNPSSSDEEDDEFDIRDDSSYGQSPRRRRGAETRDRQLCH